MRQIILVVLALLSLGWSWKPLPDTGPSARFFHDLAYDRSANLVVMFGGSDDISGMGDTWIHDGSGWAQASPIVSPSARLLHAMEYDRSNKQVLLFGGQEISGSFFGDTWLYDPVLDTWTEQFPTTSPQSRSRHVMASAIRDREVWLVGGVDSTGVTLADTWFWDGSDWTEVTSATSLPQIRFPQVTWDSRRDMLVLFGGIDELNQPLDSLYELDLTSASPDWIQVPKAGTWPDARFWHFGFRRGRWSTFGSGYTGVSNTPDTWGWNGSVWQLFDADNGIDALDSGKACWIPDGSWGFVFGGYGLAGAVSQSAEFTNP